MPELPANILTSLTNIPHIPELAKAYLQPLDLAPDEVPPWNVGGAEVFSAVSFQYWPETIQDSRGSEWNPRNIPGGSHPLYQWTHGGERRISFTAIFSTDTAPDEIALAQSEEAAAAGAAAALIPGLLDPDDVYSIQDLNPLGGIEKGTRDVDLRAVVGWLRWFTYPYYSEGDDWRAFEPAKALLVMPHMSMGYLGEDHITTVMTQCDITYEACFENGFPRLIEVALEFAEVVQEGERVQFHNRRLMADAGYARNVHNYLGTRGTER